MLAEGDSDTHLVSVTNTVARSSLFLQQHYAQLLHDWSALQNGLESYVRILEDTRTKYNLMGPRELVSKHVIDCLAPFGIIVELLWQFRAHKQLAKSEPIVFADLGSGAGLPGVVLALALSAAQMPSRWYLLEQSTKKAGFLQEAINAISPYISNAELTVIPKTLREWKQPPAIQFLTFRAFKPLKDILKPMRTLAPQAELLMYKGRFETILEELSAWVSKDNFATIAYNAQHKTNLSSNLDGNPSGSLGRNAPRANANKTEAAEIQEHVIYVNAIYSLEHEVDKERHLVHATWAKSS